MRHNRCNFSLSNTLATTAFMGLLALFGSLGMAANPASNLAHSEKDDSWVEATLASLTLHEKIGQMLMIDVEGTHLTPQLRQFLKQGHFGNVVLFERNVESTEQVQEFIMDLQMQAQVETGVPLLVAVDQEGGLVDRLSHATQDSAMRYGAHALGKAIAYAPERAPSLVNLVTRKIAAKMKELGFNMNLAPVLDLTDSANSYIFKRSYGSDPEQVTKIAGDYSKIMRMNGIATTGKHFPNLSFTHQDSHQDLPVLSRTLEQLSSYEFLPFKNLKTNLSAIMVGHILVPAVDRQFPASISPSMVRLLRKNIGFKGVIISDDLKMKALSDHYSLAEIVLRSVNADVDMLIMAWDQGKQKEATRILETAVQKQKISVDRIDQSVRRILRLKQEFAR